MMPIAVLLCVICSIAASNGNVQEDIDISKDRMVQTVDNHEFDVDVDANDFRRLPTIQGNEKNVEVRQAIADRPFAENLRGPTSKGWTSRRRSNDHPRRGKESIAENVEVLQGIADRPRKG